MIANRNIDLSGDKRFGPLPLVATASLEALSAKNKGSLVYDSTANIVKFSTGAGGAWTSVGTAATSLNELSDVVIASAATGHILTHDGTDWKNKAVSGDITLSGAGVAAIAAGVIANADVSSTAAIVLSKLASGANGQLIICNASGVPTYSGITGDIAITNAGATTVTDLTISSEAQGDVLYFNGTNWVRLAAGTSGKFLKTGGAGANPSWDTVSTGIASSIASPFTVEGGTFDPATTVTTQTTSAAALTIPDLGGTAQQWVFSAAAQTLSNKTLTAPVITSIVSTNTHTVPAGSGNDTFVLLAATQTLTNKTLTTPTITSIISTNTHSIPAGGGNDTFALLAAAQTLTNKTLTTPVISSISNTGTVTLPTATDTLVARATTDTLTNKTIDAALNTVSNLSAAEADPGTVGTDLDLIPFIISKDVSNATTTVIFNANAPYKFRVIDAWVVSTGTNTGTWKIDNGTNDITTAVNYGSDTGISRAASIDDLYHAIAANGSLRCINSVATDDAILYVQAIRVD